MFTRTTDIAGRRAIFASAIALSSLLAVPVLPSGLSADAPLFGAAFARHGADDGGNDDGHHRHGADDTAGKNDDHGGRNPNRPDDHPGLHQHRGGR